MRETNNFHRKNRYLEQSLFWLISPFWNIKLTVLFFPKWIKLGQIRLSISYSSEKSMKFIFPKRWQEFNQCLCNLEKEVMDTTIGRGSTKTFMVVKGLNEAINVSCLTGRFFTTESWEAWKTFTTRLKLSKAHISIAIWHLDPCFSVYGAQASSTGIA